MGRIKNYFVLFISIVFSIYAWSAELKPRPDMRLIVSGGLGGVHDGFEAFFRSPLFRLGGAKDSKLQITNTTQRVYRFDDTYYITSKPIAPELLLEIAKGPVVAHGKVNAFMSSAKMAVKVTQDFIPMPLKSSELPRALGGIDQELAYLARADGDVTVVAVSLRKDMIKWPKSVGALDEVPAAWGKQGDDNFVFFARSTSSTVSAFGLIDKLLADKKQIPTNYIDLGNSLASPNGDNASYASLMREFLLHRNPAVLSTGKSDFFASSQYADLLKNDLFILPTTTQGKIRSTKVITLDKQQVMFTQLGGFYEQASIILPEDTQLLSLKESIDIAEKEASTRNIKWVFAIAHSSEAQAVASSSPVFDALFTLTPASSGSLAAETRFSLGPNLKEGERPLPPIIRISPREIAEVLIWKDAQENISQLEIIRHPILEDSNMKAKDVAEKVHEFVALPHLVGLPERALVDQSALAWTEDEIDVISASLLKKAARAEVVLVEKRQPITPIVSDIDYRLSRVLLGHSGRLVVVELLGSQVQKLFSVVRAGKLLPPLVVVGANVDLVTIERRNINPNERYRVAFTEALLPELNRLSNLEPILGTYVDLPGLIDAAMSEKVGIKNWDKYKRAGQRLKPKPVFKSGDGFLFVSDIIKQNLDQGITALECRNYLNRTKGAKQRLFVLDISDMDFGLNGNIVTGKARENASKFSLVPDSRLTIPSYLHALVNINTSASYITPDVETTLAAQIKFYDADLRPTGIEHFGQGSQDKPINDSTKVTAEIRIPLNTKDEKAWVLMPTLRGTYETKLWPLGFLTNVPKEDWGADRVVEEDGKTGVKKGKNWLPRMSKLSGFLGGTVKPAGGDENFRVGLVTLYDFTQDNFGRAFSVGGELGGVYGWKVGAFNLKVEGSLNAYASTIKPDVEDNRLQFVSNIVFKAMAPVWGQVSFGVIADFYAGSLMGRPSELITSSIIGLALSYSDHFKWLL